MIKAYENPHEDRTLCVRVRAPWFLAVNEPDHKADQGFSLFG